MKFIERLLPRKLREGLEYIEIRWPHLAVLRLHYVLAWFLVGSGLAFAFAPLHVGTTQDIGSPGQYMGVWTILSLMASLLWIAMQWRDRPSLPRKQSIPILWSSLVSTLILACFFSVAVVAGYAAERRIRSLVTREEIENDCNFAGVSTTGDLLRPRGGTFRDGLPVNPFASGLDFKGSDKKTELVKLQDIMVDPSVLALANLRKDERWSALLARYVPKELLDENMRAMGNLPVNFMSDLTQEQCSFSVFQSIRDKRDARHGFERACSDMSLILFSVDSIREYFHRNMAIVHVAYNIEHYYAWSTYPTFILGLLFLSAVLGIFVGCIGMLSMRISAIVYLISIAVTSLPFSYPRTGVLFSGAFMRYSINLHSTAPGPDFYGWLIFAIALVLIIVIASVIEHARSLLMDIGLVFIQIWLPFLLFTQYREANLTFFINNVPKSEVHLNPWPNAYINVFLALFASLASGFFFLRYRTLPYKD